MQTHPAPGGPAATQSPRSWRAILLALPIAFAALMVALTFAISGRAEDQQSTLAKLISQLLSSQASQVSIGGIDGALSSDATIRNLTIADADGVWLRVDRVRLVWSRLALLARRLEVDQLEIGKLEILRRPIAAAGDPGAVETAGQILPELPVRVIVKAFQLDELELGAPVLGMATRLGAKGEVRLGPPSEGLVARLDIRRLDGEGVSAINLSFVPQGERLDLKVEHREAEGGLLAHIASIPGRPKTALDLEGSGTLDDWSARLGFTAGPTIGAEGQARLQREGERRRLDLNMESRIEGLLPPAAAGVFAGTTALTGAVWLGDDGAIDLSGLRLASDLAELDVTGQLGVAAAGESRPFDVNLRARARPGPDGVARRGDASIEHFLLTARAQGRLDRPQAEGILEARGVSLPDFGFSSARADIKLTPADGERLDLRADASVEGLTSPHGGVAEAAGQRIEAQIRAAIGPDGRIEVAEAKIASPVYDVTYRGAIDGGRIQGSMAGAIAELGAFSTIAGRPLAGKADVALDIDLTPAESLWNVGFRAQATALSLDDERLDRMTGGAVAATGRIRLSPEQAALERVTIIGRGFEAGANGALGKNGGLGKNGARDEAAGIRLTLRVADLALVDPRLRGEAEAAGVLAGDLANPDGFIEVRSNRMTAAGKPVRDLRLRLDGTSLAGALRAALTMEGSVDGRKLTGGGQLARQDDGGWRIGDLRLSLGAAQLDGDADISGDGLIAGKLSLDAPDLRHVSALLLTEARGALKAEIAFARDNGRQDLGIAAQARNLVIGGLRMASADADLALRDLFARPTARGTAQARNLQVAGERIARLDLTAKGSGDVTAFTAAASGGTLGFDLAGELRSGDTIRIALQRLSAARGGARVSLAAPATVDVIDGGLRTSGLTLTANGGRVTIAGRVGERLDLDLRAQNVPLSLARAFDPAQASLAGQINATANVRGAVGALQGGYKANIAGLANPQTRNAGLPPMTIALEGQFRGDRVTVSGQVRGGKTIALNVRGAVPLSARGNLDLAISGAVDAALADAALTASGQRVTGRLALDLTVRGTTANPALAGSAELTGGSFRDAVQGVTLTGIAGRFTGRGERIVIDRLSASTPRGGAIAVSGTVSVDPAAGFPADLRIQARRAQLLSNDVVTLVAGLNLAITGPLATEPVVRGAIDVQSMDVRIPDRLPASAEPLRNAKHIDPPAQTRARLEDLARARQRAAARGRGGGPRIDLRINAPNQIFVRGRGLDAELGGSLRVTGTAAEPRADGAFELRRGRLDLLTQRIDFTRGRLTFAGDVMPELDFVASSAAGGVTAQVLISGRADAPQFTFTSTPELPPDEVLSRLLFERAAGALTPFQALQLAAAVGTLTGQGGPGFLDQTRQALGVDTLDIEVGEGGPRVGASRYISRRISVGVKAGTTPEQSAATVRIDLTRRLKIMGEMGGDGRASLGIGAEIEY